MYHSVLILLILPCIINGQLRQVCVPTAFTPSPTDPPLPRVPQQFSAIIEGNLVARSESHVVTEYYDQIGDRGRIEFDFNGTRSVGIFDYNLGEVFLFPDPRGGECRVFDISNNSRMLSMAFGFTEGENGTLHIGSPANFLERIQNTSTAIHLGTDTIREIPVHRWQACVSMPNNTYLINYYFASQTNWTYGIHMDPTLMIPIQFTLNASFVTPRAPDGVDNAYNVYSFFNYQTGPDSVPDNVFQVPTGLACKGRIPGQPLPSLPDTFSARIEAVVTYMNRPVVATIQEYYDYQRNLFRLDYYDRDGPISLVHDFNEGVQFRTNLNTNMCTRTLLSNITNFPLIDSDINSGDLPRIASPQQFFLLENFYNYSYEGISTVRNVSVDSWVSVRNFEQFPGGANLTNGVYEVFFTRPGTTVVNGHSFTTVPVPLRAVIRGDFTSFNGSALITTTRSLQYDLFDATTQPPPFDTFDVSACYDNDDVISVILEINGTLNGFNLGEFQDNIRQAIVNYTGVAPLQIGSITLLEQPRENEIHVHVIIANLTSFATTPMEGRVNSDKALQMLLSSTTDITNPFMVTIPPNITVFPSIHASGQGRGVPQLNNSCETPPTCQPLTCPTPIYPTCSGNNNNNLQEQLALKDREIIGIAIGLFFGGLIIGGLLTLLVVCVCRCVCKGSGKYSIGRSVKYEKHDDDIAFPT